MTEILDVEIERLGAQGDGIAAGRDGPIYVPGALAGERVRVERDEAHARLIEVLAPSPDRVAAPCPHFGVCGGCSVQHLAAPAYAQWKHEAVVEALRHRGITAAVAPLVTIPAASRRRAMLGMANKDGRVLLGFREEGQHALVDLAFCHVVVPEIAERIGQLRALAAAVLEPGASGRLVVTALDNGLDVSLETGKLTPTPDLRVRLAALAEEARLVRLSLDGDPLITRERPRLTIAGVTLSPPPNIFLQAAAPAEAAMVALVGAGVGKSKHVADLFCGVGTFTFAMARRARVFAADGDRRAIETLAVAARGAAGLKPIETRVRDLFRDPLSRTELNAFDAVVFDPPRSGAKAQAETLVKSTVKRVVAVSCAPATLARDLRILLDGGFELDGITPIDQFVYTPHVEVVAVLKR